MLLITLSVDALSPLILGRKITSAPNFLKYLIFIFLNLT